MRKNGYGKSIGKEKNKNEEGNKKRDQKKKGVWDHKYMQFDRRSKSDNEKEGFNDFRKWRQKLGLEVKKRGKTEREVRKEKKEKKKV